jgi:hypothetical protein
MASSVDAPANFMETRASFLVLKGSVAAVSQSGLTGFGLRPSSGILNNTKEKRRFGNKMCFLP